MVAHVDDDCSLFDRLVELFSVEVSAGVGGVEGVVIETIGDDFFAYFDREFVE